MSDERRRQPADRRRPVLIVSANPDTLDLYVMALRNDRGATIGVNHVADALPRVRDRAVSAVVFDVTHPGIDWHGCRLVIEAGEPGLPVVVLTGWLDASARERADAIGCAAFVGKPISPERLAEIVSRVRAGERGIVSVDRDPSA